MTSPNESVQPLTVDCQLFPHSDVPLHRQEHNRPFLFTPVEIKIKEGTVVHIGRKIDRSKDKSRGTTREDRAANNVSLDVNHMTAEHEQISECIAFRSKVVSRNHAELWVGKDGQLYFRDVGSSSGTFLNRLRLSPSGKESRPYPIQSGDIIQLGVDYQGRQEEIYKAVQIKIFVNPKRNTPGHANRQRLTKAIRALVSAMNPNHTKEDDEAPAECCICINAMAPYQALFLAPCSHCFHYKCVITLLGAGFMFPCPLCRQVANLEASVAEPDDLSVQDEDEEEQFEDDLPTNSKTLMRIQEAPLEADVSANSGASMGVDIPISNLGAIIAAENTPRNYSILSRENEDRTQPAPTEPNVNAATAHVVEALTKITQAVATGDRANIDQYLQDYSTQLKYVLEASVRDQNTTLFRDILARLSPSDRPDDSNRIEE